MSDYEMLNQRIAAKTAARRKDALRRLSFLLAIVLVAILAVLGLKCIGFISKVFMVVLLATTICIGAFNAGRIWNSYKR